MSDNASHQQKKWLKFLMQCIKDINQYTSVQQFEIQMQALLNPPLASAHTHQRHRDCRGRPTASHTFPTHAPYPASSASSPPSPNPPRVRARQHRSEAAVAAAAPPIPAPGDPPAGSRQVTARLQVTAGRLGPGHGSATRRWRGGGGERIAGVRWWGGTCGRRASERRGAVRARSE